MRTKNTEKLNELQNKYDLTFKEANALYNILNSRKYNPLKPIEIITLRNQAKRYFLNFERFINIYKKWLDNEAQKINKKAINGLLVKRAKNGSLMTNEIYFIDDLTTLYELLQCRVIDIQERVINNSIYDFIFDDEMLLKEPTFKQIIATDTTNNEAMIKRLLIVGRADENGQETSLKYDDISRLIRSRKIIANNNEQIEVLNYSF